MKSKERKNESTQNSSSRLHEIRSENARKEKRDSRGRFIASDKSQSKSNPSSNRNQNDDSVDIIIIEEEFGGVC